jgi:uroporphyrinogen-III synthase
VSRAERRAQSVVLTRPALIQHEADAFRHAGWTVLHVPLLRIEAVQDASLLEQAWRSQVLDPDRVAQALMFVSANAVDHFMQACPIAAPQWTQRAAMGPRAWATGPATAAALGRWGWPAACIDWPGSAVATFDSEALWAVVRDQVRPGARILIVRGGDAQGQAQGRAWLAERLQEAGANVHECVAYRASAAAWTDEQGKLAQQACDGGSVWVLQSSQALLALVQALPAQDWSQVPVVVTHPRIAQTASRLGFADVSVIGGAVSPDKIAP